MNILHHKSWHVYNKANVERVKRDEAQAEAEAKKKHDRANLAESEARLQQLRKRAEDRLPLEQRETSKIEHVNLFQDLEKEQENEENQAEKKKEEEKMQKQMTMYLDKGATKEDEPWYAKLDRKEEKYKDPHAFKKRDDKKSRHKSHLKVNEDPLDYITSTLKKREEKKSKKEHKHHSKRHSRPKSTKAPTIEELRAKRLEREKGDHARLKSLYLDHQKEEEEVDLDDRKRGYNSQYNREDTVKAKEGKRIRWK